jgi:hypothetical protein
MVWFTGAPLFSMLEVDESPHRLNVDGGILFCPLPHRTTIRPEQQSCERHIANAADNSGHRFYNHERFSRT